MAEIVLLDGGMGQELIARSQQPPSPLWSAQVLLEEPELVEAAHRAFLEAGSTVITLNAYAATPQRLARQGREDLFAPLQAKAVALTLDDDASPALRSGEPLAEAMAALADVGVDARLLNCSRPETIDAVWDAFAAPRGTCGAYANGFTSVTALAPGGTVDSLEARRDLTPDAHAEVALSWVSRGAEIVGGCCEVGPEHIRVLAARLREAGHTVVAP